MTDSKMPLSSIVTNVLIALVAIYGLMDLIYTFTGVYAKFGLLYPAAHGLLNILLFMALSFIWSKERWAIWLFLGIACVQILVDLIVTRPIGMQLVLFIPAIYFLISQKK
jgi:hypothetical protein